MGKGSGGFSRTDWWSSDHAALAHSARTTAQTVLVAPDDVCRRDSQPHSRSLGYFLQSEVSVVAVPVHKIDARATSVCPDFKNLSPDVCRYGNFHRQRARLAVRPEIGRASCRERV